jgi:hypothetical protein
MALLYTKPAAARTKNIPSGVIDGSWLGTGIVPKGFLVECRAVTKH